MNRLLTLATVTVALCAIAVTGMTIRREFLGQTIESSAPVSRAPKTVKDWKSIAERGTTFGPPRASIVITEFSDFQCPYCKRLAQTLHKVAQAYPTQVSFAYRHFPIDRIHRHARDAAYLSECAARVGRFKEMHDLLYQEQDSIGVLSWSEFARRIQINDTSSILACMADTAIAARVKKDEAGARELGIRGTPLVLINQSQFDGVPTYAVMDSVIRSLLAKK